MAKTKKPYLIFQAKMKSGVVTTKQGVMSDLQISSKVEFLEEGEYSDGTKYAIVKIFVPAENLS